MEDRHLTERKAKALDLAAEINQNKVIIKDKEIFLIKELAKILDIRDKEKLEEMFRRFVPD